MSCILSFPHGFLLRLICRFLLTLLVCLKNTTTTTSIEKFFYLAYKNLLPIHFFHVSHIHSLYNYHQKVKSGFCSFLFVFLEATHANAKKKYGQHSHEKDATVFFYTKYKKKGDDSNFNNECQGHNIYLQTKGPCRLFVIQTYITYKHTPYRENCILHIFFLTGLIVSDYA